MTELLTLLDGSLAGRAERPAIALVDGTTLTFGEVDARARAAWGVLRQHGLARDDRLVIHLSNGIDFIVLVLACLRAGVIVVPANVLYKERELAHIVADAEPRLVVTAEAHRDRFASGAPVVTIERLRGEMTAARQPSGAGARDAALGPEAPALMVYTSGTTGRPKGAVLSHGNLAANTTNLLRAWRITSADRYFAALPLFHIHGLGNGMFTWLASGNTMRLEERFDHTTAAATIEAFGTTLFFGVPTMYVRMLDWPDDVARRIGRAMRLFVCGSAALPSHVLEAFRAKFGHVILERYGMSETLMNLGNPYEGERRPGSVGVPFPGVSARIVDDAGAAVADGTVGQLEVKGPNVFRAYWRNSEATARAFRDGWFRTGDMAERSADGYVTLRGRSSDLIISGGFNIYPREIEEWLLEQPGVREAAVAAAPDPLRGEVPVAYVVLREGATTAALHEACARALASFKVPRAFIAVDALPRTALGKVQKHLLPPARPA